MSIRCKLLIVLVSLQICTCVLPMLGQQKPQWVPGQVGLNAGILPSPGFTYVNMTLNYDADRYNNLNGKAIRVTGTYNVWAIQNIFYWVADAKVFRGNLGAMVIFPTPATGSLVAEIPNLQFPNLGATGGGSGLADLWLQPVSIGWHLKRADLQVVDAFMIPTGRYSPGASDNVGSGYFGNHLQTGSTYYITKDKGTSANLFTDWEVHGSRDGVNNTSTTPGQAFTDEWGVGQVLPLKKDMSQLVQLGESVMTSGKLPPTVGQFHSATLRYPRADCPTTQSTLPEANSTTLFRPIISVCSSSTNTNISRILTR